MAIRQMPRPIGFISDRVDRRLVMTSVMIAGAALP